MTSLAFILFELQHLITLAVISIWTTCLVAYSKRTSGSRLVKLRYVLSIACFSLYPLQLCVSAGAGHGLPTENLLPLHLCDLAAICCGFALITDSRLAAELSYFWGLSGTALALITPDIHCDFPSPVYLFFFWKHGIVVSVAILLPCALGWRPARASYMRVLLSTTLYGLCVLGVNQLMGTNYAYLMTKPSSQTGFDLLPEWPWYLLSIELLCAVIFAVLFLPFYHRSVK